MNNHARLTLAAALLSSVALPAFAQAGPDPAASVEPQTANAAAPADGQSSSSGQQDSAEDRGEIVVTGSRSPKAVDKIAGAVTVITSAEVKRSLTITEDATAVLARSVPGYSESNQTMNTLGETMRGRTALYMFDGIPQSTPLRDGSRNATFTDMATVERIEVIGGASAAEGIGAAGGIINYISKRATEPGTHFGVSGRFGTQFDDDSSVWKVGATIAHKSDAIDIFAAASYLSRGITYDARGRRIGLSASSSLADSKQVDFFLKVGKDFGANDSQRLEAEASYFKLTANGDYHYVAGLRPPAGKDQTTGIPDTAEPGPPVDPLTGQLLFKPDFNRFQQYAVNYTNKDLVGGSLVATAYYAKQEMRFPGDNAIDKQDPKIDPTGKLYDQSEILSKKYGLRTSYTHPDFLLKGLELRFGIDLVHDQTQQYLAVTNRVWVPPMNYTSFGPYVQLEYEIGPITLSGGMRHEDGRVKVDDYTTTAYRNSVFVKGGTLNYKNDLFNAGAIGRLGSGFSVYATYGEGFTLPNFGIPLRNVNVPGKSVEGLLDLEAVIFKNKEVGFNWRGKQGSFGVSYYQSKSALGSSLSVDPVTKDYVLNRKPIKIYGIDVTAEFRPTSTLRLNALYSHVIGKTTKANGITSPLDVQLGIINIAPDKLNGQISWQFNPQGSVSFGASHLFSRDLNTINEHTKGYTLFDATANYRVGQVGTFSLGVENLFNKFYFLSSSQIDIYQNYFAGRGRTVSLTFSRNF
jgi:iron complex outermembrane receptor protein